MKLTNIKTDAACSDCNTRHRVTYYTHEAQELWLCDDCRRLRGMMGDAVQLWQFEVEDAAQVVTMRFNDESS